MRHQQRARVDVLLASERTERLRPRAAPSQRQHGVELLTRRLAAVEAAAVERADVPGCAAHAAVELVLEHLRQKVPHVRSIGRDVPLGSGVEVLLGPGNGWCHPLVVGAEPPPGRVVVAWRDVAREHAPTPLVDQQPNGQERNIEERLAKERWYVCVRRRLLSGEEAELAQVGGGDGQGDGVPDGFVEAVLGPILEQDRWSLYDLK